jgi:hypothetical protein
MDCNIPFCKDKVSFIVQSPKQKLHTCENHLLETLENARGMEFYVVKIDII